ncbi:hypothetical protein [uncultured Serinicoccus sp.]|uniref:hypothetical protein n=1 Tax=uncultured Serinicoccus sp. TaxID=735514 RepID=UPI0026080CB6|nr:hypothetical protein [uncultured Serinicoccus sp.]
MIEPASEEERRFLGEIVVQSHHFSVFRARGGYDYDWITGGHEQMYGFHSSSDGAAVSLEEHVEAIKEFMSRVDPDSGLMDE